MNSVILSFEEAQRILHLMRNVQMNLTAIEQLVEPVERERHFILSQEFAGELNTLVNALEGSIFESGIVELPDALGDDFRAAMPSEN